jgi:hypothetical protein
MHVLTCYDSLQQTCSTLEQQFMASTPLQHDVISLTTSLIKKRDDMFAKRVHALSNSRHILLSHMINMLEVVTMTHAVLHTYVL